MYLSLIHISTTLYNYCIHTIVHGKTLALVVRELLSISEKEKKFTQTSTLLSTISCYAGMWVKLVFFKQWHSIMRKKGGIKLWVKRILLFHSTTADGFLYRLVSASFNEGGMCDAQPVSYTHLDVYKRQVCRDLLVLKMRVMNTVK